MSGYLQTPPGTPEWSGRSTERLLVSMLLSSLLVAGVLSVLRLPDGAGFAPVVRLLVQIVRDDPPEEPLPTRSGGALEPDATPVVPEMTAAPGPSASAAAPPMQATGPGTEDSRDWDAAAEAAIEALLEHVDNPPSVNPNVDALKRKFVGRYQPPTREKPGQVWDNVERDSLGRSVLRSGDCWRVIDDPNVGSQEAFREFGQYLVLCSFSKRKPRELPWVAVIRDRYPYLKYPDGEVPPQAAE